MATLWANVVDKRRTRRRPSQRIDLPHMPLNTQRYLRVSQADKKTHNAWAEGSDLQTASGRSIDELRRVVSAARMQLAREMLQCADAISNGPRPRFRQIISRSYYAMYHALRACTYMSVLGDDHQSHSELPKRIPDDFPSQQIWGNQLKSAREYRNQADYDPYPRSIAHWKSIAPIVLKDAQALLPIAASYLRGKGCRL